MLYGIFQNMISGFSYANRLIRFEWSLINLWLNTILLSPYISNPYRTAFSSASRLPLLLRTLHSFSLWKLSSFDAGLLFSKVPFGTHSLSPSSQFWFWFWFLFLTTFFFLWKLYNFLSLYRVLQPFDYSVLLWFHSFPLIFAYLALILLAFAFNFKIYHWIDSENLGLISRVSFDILGFLIRDNCHLQQFVDWN